MVRIPKKLSKGINKFPNEYHHYANSHSFDMYTETRVVQIFRIPLISPTLLRNIRRSKSNKSRITVRLMHHQSFGLESCKLNKIRTSALVL